MAPRAVLLAALCGCLAAHVSAADAPVAAPDVSSPAFDDDDEDPNVSPAVANRSPTSLLRRAASAILPPLKVFAQAPPITRSWVSASVVMALLTSSKVIDPRDICFSEPMVLHEGQWWRLIANFFYMGDAVKSIFFWVQLHHFWECCKMLELVKYRWEPADFIKLIVTNAFFLLCLKQLFPSTIFLGTPMVMAFLYMYAREYEMQVMNLLGFFSIRCGWLPFAQMLQDYLQMGDVTPNALGLISGHTYFYLSEVKPRLELPEQLTLDDIYQLLAFGKPLDIGEEVLGGDADADGDAADAAAGEGGDADAADDAPTAGNEDAAGGAEEDAEEDAPPAAPSGSK